MALDGPGQTIAHYELVRRMGRGGIGVVYLARDVLRHREVALKTLLPELATDDSVRAWFAREARAAASLHHRNIVSVIEYSADGDWPYIVMEFLPGESLAARIARAEPLTLGAKLDIVIQLCQGLQFAHDLGIVHRGLKPANIWMLPDGGVKLLDFGIAALPGSATVRRGAIAGAASYMAPEQITETAVDRRADLFSAGVVLYELLAGQRPFEGASTTAVISKIVREAPPPLRSLVPHLPDDVIAAVDTALQKDREARYAEASELGADLQLARYALPAAGSEPTVVAPAAPRIAAAPLAVSAAGPGAPLRPAPAPPAVAAASVPVPAAPALARPAPAAAPPPAPPPRATTAAAAPTALPARPRPVAPPPVTPEPIEGFLDLQLHSGKTVVLPRPKITTPPAPERTSWMPWAVVSLAVVGLATAVYMKLPGAAPPVAVQSAPPPAATPPMVSSPNASNTATTATAASTPTVVARSETPSADPDPTTPVHATAAYAFSIDGCGQRSAAATDHVLNVRAPCTLTIDSAAYLLHKTYRIEPGRETVTLQPPAVVRVSLSTSQHENCRVRLGDRDLGEAMGLQHDVAAGEYRVTLFRCGDQRTYSGTITVVPGQSRITLDDKVR